MVVAHIIDSLDTGGAEVVAVNMANALSRVEGVTAHLVVTRHAEGDLRQRIAPGVQLLVLNKKGPLDIKALFRLRNYFIRENVDVVHAHSTSFLYPAILEPFSNFMLVWHDHYGLPVRPDGKRNYPYKLFSPLFDHVFCVSQQLVENAQKHLHVNPHHIQLLYNFSVPLQVSPAQQVAKPKDKKVIVMSANLRPQKDHGNLIAAVQLLVQKLPDIVVYCIGAGKDEAYKDSLKAKIEAAGLQNTLFLMGAQPNPFAYYNIADLAVLSSSSEGLPLTLIEYGFAGCAVVCTDVGQSAAVVNRESGWIVPAAHPQELADNMLYALTHPDEAANKATRLQKHVHKFFSEEAAIEVVLKVYNAIVKT
ncbi:MAG: glycosyltransferase [Chitinophagaceae bacterium]|nr:glycosyltransferase [Chitinophagaceae bacterium]